MELAESPREHQLMVALLMFRWHPHSPIIPSVDQLRRIMKCSDRTVRRTAEKMEARGLLRREARHAHDRRQMSNRYVLCGAFLSLVTAIEANRDQEQSSTWQGRRTRTSGERYEPNQKNRTTQQNRQSQPAGTYSELTRTREGTLSRLRR
jgi:DNA-binding transcriptional MocR family regulator